MGLWRLSGYIAVRRFSSSEKAESIASRSGMHSPSRNELDAHVGRAEHLAEA
jgi:hypothetical protein